MSIEHEVKSSFIGDLEVPAVGATASMSDEAALEA